MGDTELLFLICWDSAVLSIYQIYDIYLVGTFEEKKVRKYLFIDL